MSKRFTDTNKFDDPWYCNLSNTAKLAWEYILAKCDNAGVWEPNYKLANACIEGVDWADVGKQFGDRIIVLNNGKWWAWKFVEFQCGELSPSCKPHQNVIRLLRQHGIYEQLLELQSKGYPKGMNTLQEKEQDKEQEEDKEKDSLRDARGAKKPQLFSAPAPQRVSERLPEWFTPELTEAWSQWITHLAERDSRPTRMTRLTWHQDIQRHGIAKAIETIRFSISVGAKSLCWDGPFRSGQRAGSPQSKTESQRDQERTGFKTTYDIPKL